MKTIVMSLAFGLMLCGLTSCDTYVDGGYAVARPYGYAPYYRSHYQPTAFYSSRTYYPSSYWGSGHYSRPYAYPSRYYSTRYLAPSGSPMRYVAAHAAARTYGVPPYMGRYR